jgi:hypothetical protein
MVFDISVALTWILFLALFPISFVWLRRAWRIVVNRDFSEVGIKRGESPPKPEKFAPFEMPVNLVAGGGAGMRDGRRAGWFLGVQHLERHCRQHHLVQVHCEFCAQSPCPRQLAQGQGLKGMANSLTSQRLVALFCCGWVLLNFPLLGLWDVDTTVLGVPLLPAALFTLWALLIAAVAWLMERQTPETRDD